CARDSRTYYEDDYGYYYGFGYW
nr:immunoglobulin heavy chain junction region [Macaca mulatta]